MGDIIQNLLSGDVIQLLLLVLFGISELLGMIPAFKNNAVFQLVFDVLSKLVGEVTKPIILTIWNKLLVVLGKAEPEGGPVVDEDEVAVASLKKRVRKKRTKKKKVGRPRKKR